MTNLIFEATSTALFAQFFCYAIIFVPYLQWYSNLINKLPEYLSDPLGNCPYCLAPWLFLLFYYVPIPQEIKEVCFAFGWIYFINAAFNRFIESE
jgi:hypothetical protein